MRKENRRLLLYFATAAALLLLSWLLPSTGLRSNVDLHENICLISAMASLFAGTLSMIRFYARPLCPYLWIGLCFLGNGVLEFVYAYTFTFFSLLHMRSDLASFMIGGWWLCRIYFSVMLLGACITCTSRTFVYKNRDAYILASVLLAFCLICLLVVRLPAPITATLLPRPLEFLPGALFLISLVYMFRHFNWRHASFHHFLLLATLISACSQLFIVPFSSSIYDARFMAGNNLRALAYFFVFIGLLSEIFHLYRSFGEETNKLMALRLAVNQISDYALFMLDTDGYIISWNKGAEKIKGYTADEIIGKHFSIFYLEEEKRSGKPRRDLEEALEEGHVIDEGWRVRKDGNRFWAYLILTPIYDEAGALLGYSKITRDLTERMLLEEELRRQNEMLSSSNEQLTQFAYIATHDLKEPLRTIASFTQLLTRICVRTDVKATEYSRFIITSVDRIRKLIDDLRTYSIISAQKADQLSVSLVQSLEDALKLLNKKITDAGATIHYSDLPVVSGSPIQLTYLFLHLIDNAIKYAKPGIPAEVDISYTISDAEYIISIRDNGIGIKEEYAEKLFTIFHKLDNRNKTEGSGIGLSICKKVVAMHGGKIWYLSYSEGTTFFFSLPIKKYSVSLPQHQNYNEEN